MFFRVIYSQLKNILFTNAVDSRRYILGGFQLDGLTLVLLLLLRSARREASADTRLVDPREFQEHVY